MARWLGQRWSAANGVYMVNQQRVADVAGGLGTLAKLLRMALQSAVLAIGALLVIRQEASAGIIIAASILSTRALAPVDAAIANWRGLLAARQAWRRLNGLLRSAPGGMEPMPLPTPQHRLSVEGVAAVAPGDTKLIIQNVNFTLEAGQGLGVIGPSAAGKTTLARLLVGIWKPVRGSIRLDNAAIDQWSPEQFGRFIGYVPQDVELFAGTIAENISRFDPSANSDDIIAAAREAGVHDMILGLRDGYDTEVGMSGANLSAGQQQRIALARALYGKPFLVVLDEPNSNLDTDGEAALTHAILSVRKRGGIAIVIAHRSSALAGVDHILLMHPGTSPTLGPKSEVLAKLMRPLVPAETTPPTAAGQVIR
jgi:ATP-binding cassette subfamily C protein